MIQVKFDGGKELAEALATLSTRVSKSIQREALIDAAEPMRSRMEQLAPRGPDAPHIKDQIVISNSRGQDGQEVAIAVGPSKGSFYGTFLEFGTVHMHARPFVRPAFDEKAPGALRLFADAVWLALAGRGVNRATTVVNVPVSGPGPLV